MISVQTMSKRQMEDEINEAFIAFQEEYMGSTPASVRTYIVQDILMIRLAGILSASELKLAENQEGCLMVKHNRLRLLENLGDILSNIVKGLTGCSPASLHADVNTRTGEMLLTITLSEDLEQKLSTEE
jgi:uncharacterized protein YbcI